MVCPSAFEALRIGSLHFTRSSSIRACWMRSCPKLEVHILLFKSLLWRREKLYFRTSSVLGEYLLLSLQMVSKEYQMAFEFLIKYVLITSEHMLYFKEMLRITYIFLKFVVIFIEWIIGTVITSKHCENNKKLACSFRY